MIKDSYAYNSPPNKTVFIFYSEGKKAKIKKGIIFTKMEGNLWNLAFGDVVEGDIDDSIINNNHDFVKLFGTIAKATYEFSAKYPKRQIHIEPVDEKRKNLYNHIFRRHYEDINLVFHITGIYLNSEKEDYSPQKNYDFFRLKRKFVK